MEKPSFPPLLTAGFHDMDSDGISLFLSTPSQNPLEEVCYTVILYSLLSNLNLLISSVYVSLKCGSMVHSLQRKP